ncbi:MAG: 3-deoxy-manno-octulosonate cytidylyltransferase [Synergistaceae bacterium]|jgi:3-deoxy-manno-octulosonate cytidylyltransferase (CMP-KDO synthetase)|nr:3-deoxy-manno-octulosonate cytidylyltransferase [Synergistaceae bacterium]
MPDIETLAVIPARLKSTRLPEKPLIKLAGRELVLWVLDGARSSKNVDMAIVATDDERVASVVERAGGTAMMTPAELPTGSDRVAWVARRVPSRFVLNVQGDDPLVSASVIDPMIEALKSGDDIGLVVLAKVIDKPEEVTRDSIVKMVFDREGRALYFSRCPIPFVRDPKSVTTERFKHIGPYAWRRDALFEFASWDQTPLERAESLEMLRMLEHGKTIKCVKTETDSIEIDTPDDVREFTHYIKQRGGY